MRARMVIPTLPGFWIVFVTFGYCADDAEKEKAAAEAATVWLALVNRASMAKAGFRPPVSFAMRCRRSNGRTRCAGGELVLATWEGGILRTRRLLPS